MGNINHKSLRNILLPLLLILLMSYALAEETVIKHEKLSYGKCLKVITSSQNKLSVVPIIEDVSDQKRIALFNLIDGTLTIICDGEEGSVKVLTNLN